MGECQDDSVREIAVQTTRKRFLQLLALVAVNLGLTANLASGQSTNPYSANQLQFVEDIPSPTQEAIPMPTASSSLAPSEPTTRSLDMPFSDPVQVGPDLAFDGDVIDPYDFPVEEAFVGNDVAEVFSTNNWFQGGYWYSTQEFVMLLRDNIPLIHIAADFSGATSTDTLPFLEAMDTKTANFVYEAGTRLSIGHVLGRDVGNRNHAVELSFLGLFDYTGRSDLAKVNPNSQAGVSTYLASVEGDIANVGGSSGYININPVRGFTDADAQSILFLTDFNSLELNYRRDARAHRDRIVMQPDGRWVRFDTPSRVTAGLAGVRYIRIDDVFQYRSVGPTFNQLTDGGFYQVTTDNALVGFQLGGEITEKYTNWAWGILGKLGGFVNFADRDSFVETVFDGQTSTRAAVIERPELCGTCRSLAPRTLLPTSEHRSTRFL